MHRGRGKRIENGWQRRGAFGEEQKCPLGNVLVFLAYSAWHALVSASPGPVQQTSIPQLHWRVGSILIDVTKMLKITFGQMGSTTQTVTWKTAMHFICGII